MKTTAKKSTDKPRRKRSDVYEQARREMRDEIQKWLESLPEELAEDLKQLFKLLAEAEDPKAKSEIAETINELLVPSSLLVKLEEQFKLSAADAAVRERLTDYRKKVGKAIKKHRTAKKLSQGALADLAGIPQSHVSRLETGVHVPTHVTIEKIAKALGVCPSQIDPGFESVEPE
ncbi:helix-turn-helix domain-containing protein [Lacipirellula parvula]|nr:helix-turn-helix transcriptional regulator [Lacipirellula parvula]